MRNLNLLFNKTYYDKIGSDDFSEQVKKNNSKIYNAEFDHDLDYTKSLIATHTGIFKVAYPGLLIGIGNRHGSGLCNDDINAGFYFDYVTGQPIIPASSVKGALRTHFKNTPEVIEELISADRDTVKTLEKELFEGEDCFLDAVIFDGDSKKHIIGKENITPHASPEKNPIPISLLKILPDVRLEFRFVLKDGRNISADEKMELLTKLLEIFGVGAKTNVGFGVLHKSDDSILPKEQNSDTIPVRTIENVSKEQIICKHCGISNYKYYPDGNLRRKCRQCKYPL